jgi:hypothetical protein
MKYFVWKVDENLIQERLVKELSPNKKQLRGKWEQFIKDFDDLYVIGYRMGHFVDGELFPLYIVFDDRNEMVYKSKKKIKEIE